MRAGRLRHRVQFQTVTEVDDGAGNLTETPTNAFTAWGELTTVGGREFQLAKQTTPSLSHQLRVRYRADLTPKLRALVDGVALNVTAVLPDNARREALLFCEELVQ